MNGGHEIAEVCDVQRTGGGAGIIVDDDYNCLGSLSFCLFFVSLKVSFFPINSFCCISLSLYIYIYVSLAVDGPQRARLPIPPTSTSPSYL